MPRPVKSGAVVAGVQLDSGSTVVVTMPYGTLLLLFEDELDVSSVESLTSFIKAHTVGTEYDTMGEVTAGPFNENVGRITELEESNQLLYALHEIAETSEDAESVRVAFIALTNTQVGQSYLRENPIKL